MSEHDFTIAPRGPFDLLHQNRYFNGWPTLTADPQTIVMAFPVEGWSGSAAVTLRQSDDAVVHLKVHPPTAVVDVAQAHTQALAALSLDEDGSGWPEIGTRDPVIGRLQSKYRLIRPTLFHSPYEAAAAFVIGHRISIAQTRIIRKKMAGDIGETISVGADVQHAFPAPQQLRRLDSYPGLNDTKIDRLHSVADAAIDGLLDRETLRAMSEPEALRALQTIAGVGPFFAQGILYRGAGMADGLISDQMRIEAVRSGYELPDDAPGSRIDAIIDGWRPYRSWATVLMHLDAREGGRPTKRTPKGLTVQR
jgi:DNA-3-methyladenine glycosylase II